MHELQSPFHVGPDQPGCCLGPGRRRRQEPGTAGRADGGLDEAPLAFAHPLLRGAVYRDMAGPERAEAHRRTARLLCEAHASAARVAEHLLATTPAGDSWTVGQLRAAAREAAARGAPESAAAYLGRAVAEPPSTPRPGRRPKVRGVRPGVRTVRRRTPPTDDEEHG
ncbi:MAG TPA: hypothetical protein VHZ02_14025 [Acidimicrobiales bacterium]|nr:hypothetical protein [Acidimicrobiales bacterium]